MNFIFLGLCMGECVSENAYVQYVSVDLYCISPIYTDLDDGLKSPSDPRLPYLVGGNCI